MWQKLILLFIYLFFYILILRSWDWVYYDLLGIAVPSFVDPITLNARQLRAMLDGRGIFYVGIVEKKELSQLVIESGGANAADLHEYHEGMQSSRAAHGSGRDDSRGSTASNNGRVTLETEVQQFTSGSHFNEQVEDCKDSAWIVQVIAKNQQPAVNEYLWLRLIRTLANFGIRFGTFDCRLDYTMCQVRRWNTSRLLLALPDDGNQAKSAVTSYTYDPRISGYRYQPLMEWINGRVGRRVQRLQTRAELMSWMSRTREQTTSVCLLLVTSLTLPPFFLSALSVKFNGRVKFAMINHAAAAGFGRDEENEDDGATDEDDKTSEAGRASPSTRPGKYIVFSPSLSSVSTFGGVHHRREPLTYPALHSFLRWLTPDLNDVFVFSVAFTNLLVLLTLFECHGRPIQILLHLAWTTLKYNFFLLLIWLALLSLINYRFMISICDYAASALRQFTVSFYGRRLIDHWLEIRLQASSQFRNGYSSAAAFVISFLGFNGFVYYLRRKFGLFGGLTQLDDSWPSVRDNVVDGSRWRGDWFIPPNIANGLQFAPTGALTLWGGIGAPDYGFEETRLYRLDDPTVEALHIDSKLEQLIRKLGITDICPYPRVPYDYVLEIPTIRYKRGEENKGQHNSPTCPICLEAYREGDAVARLPCDHDYHQRCIVSWLVQDQPNCPCCRRPANAGQKVKIQ